MVDLRKVWDRRLCLNGPGLGEWMVGGLSNGGVSMEGELAGADVTLKNFAETRCDAATATGGLDEVGALWMDCKSCLTLARTTRILPSSVSADQKEAFSWLRNFPIQLRSTSKGFTAELSTSALYLYQCLSFMISPFIGPLIKWYTLVAPLLKARSAT